MPELGVGDLVSEHAGEMIFVVEIPHQPGEDVDVTAGSTKGVQHLVVVNDPDLVVGKQIAVLDLGRLQQP